MEASLICINFSLPIFLFYFIHHNNFKGSIFKFSCRKREFVYMVFMIKIFATEKSILLAVNHLLGQSHIERNSRRKLFLCATPATSALSLDIINSKK